MMTEITPAVGVLPHEIKPGWQLGKVRLDDLHWPLGRPARLQTGTLAHLGPEDHVVGFVGAVSRVWPNLGTRAKISVILAEPMLIHAQHMRRLQRRWRRFHRILTYNETLLSSVPNGIFFPYGTCWVTDPGMLDLSKTSMCSLIASKKAALIGQKLRHDMADWVQETGQNVELLGRAYKPFQTKADGVAQYRYSVVIENSQEQNYFTEKLLDAVACKTVPIYWGCPNIADFVDTKGMLICETAEDIKAAVQSMSEEDYAARLPHLEAAATQLAPYSDIIERAATAILRDEPVPQRA